MLGFVAMLLITGLCPKIPSSSLHHVLTLKYGLCFSFNIRNISLSFTSHGSMSNLIQMLGVGSDPSHFVIVIVMLVFVVGLLNSCWQTTSTWLFWQVEWWTSSVTAVRQGLTRCVPIPGHSSHTHTHSESTERRINVKCLHRTWPLVRTRIWKCVRVWVS